MPRRRRPPRPGAISDFPPLKILTQIVILQALFYLSLLILVVFTVLIMGRSFSLDLLFGWRSVRGDTTAGWMLGGVWMINSFLGVISLLVLVARSKLVPDFALTLHFIHLLITTFYSGSLPQNWLWWALQICSAAFMTSLGVWSCRWRELRPITFGGSAPAAGAARDVDIESAGLGRDGGRRALEEEELGFGRGSRRGRGRDGAGEYEMVGMKAAA